MERFLASKMYNYEEDLAKFILWVFRYLVNFLFTSIFSPVYLLARFSFVKGLSPQFEKFRTEIGV